MAKSKETEPSTDVPDSVVPTGDGLRQTVEECCEKIGELNAHIDTLERELARLRDPNAAVNLRHLGVGMTAVWYEDGNERGVGHAALVLNTDGKGMLTLKISKADSNEFIRYGVLPVGHPRLSEPAQLKQGCWDTPERAEERRRRMVEANKAARTEAVERASRKAEEDRKLRETEAPRLVSMVVNQGLSVEEAINILGEAHWTFEQARTYLRKSGHDVGRVPVMQ